MDWPDQSPDLNPIQNVWKLLGEKKKARNPGNLEDLWTTLTVNGLKSQNNAATW